MQDEHMLMLVLVFVLGFMVERMMRDRLIEGDKNTAHGFTKFEDTFLINDIRRNDSTINTTSDKKTLCDTLNQAKIDLGKIANTSINISAGRVNCEEAMPASLASANAVIAIKSNITLDDCKQLNLT